MIISALLASAALSAAQPSAARFEPVECPAPVVPRAQWGIVKVPENRAAPAGRTIGLHIVVLRSEKPPRLPPLFDIDGGPGLPSSKNAGFYAANPVSAGRDVVLVDQRGTGRSNPLLCAELQTGPATPMLPLGAVNACRRKLSQSADLRFYGTRDAVSDLDDVRQALGYGKIDLFGLSYGTTVALRYMHRYPEQVRAAVLMGTAPPDLRPPQHHATSAARALELVLADCESDASCSAAYPRLRKDLAAARARLAAGGRVRDELFMERLRALLYSPASRARMPLMVTRAAAGDVRELFAKPSENGAAMIADGMFLAVTCGESFSTMNYAAAAAAARVTAFGDYRLRRQQAACANWPRVALDGEPLALPQQSSAAVLFISGMMDPVTPPEFAEQVRSKLKRARHIVLPDGGHIPDGLDGLETCIDPLMISFLDHGAPERLDTSCVERVSGPAYAVK